MDMAGVRLSDRGDMSALARLYDSSLGKKYIMAITGVGLFVFVIIHMLGNLQVFLGPDARSR